MATIPTVSTYLANPTAKKQGDIEDVAFAAGVPVFVQAETRVIAKGANGVAEKTAHGTSEGGMRNNAGVVMPSDDVPGRFVTPGKA